MIFCKIFPIGTGMTISVSWQGRVKCDNPHWQDLFYRWFWEWWRIGRSATRNMPTAPHHCWWARKVLINLFLHRDSSSELHLYYTDDLDFSEKRHAMLYLNRFALINLG